LEILPEMEEKESQQQSESNISGSRENHVWAKKYVNEKNGLETTINDI